MLTHRREPAQKEKLCGPQERDVEEQSLFLCFCHWDLRCPWQGQQEGGCHGYLGEREQMLCFLSR